MNKLLIRIVDDDAELAESFALLLETMGWTVKHYADGPSFLREDTLEGPGCVVLDVRMPGMTGLEVQAELERRGSKLPILFLSAHGNIAMAVHAVRHGAADFWKKPVEPLDFVQKVSQVVTMSLAERRHGSRGRTPARPLRRLDAARAERHPRGPSREAEQGGGNRVGARSEHGQDAPRERLREAGRALPERTHAVGVRSGRHRRGRASRLTDFEDDRHDARHLPPPTSGPHGARRRAIA